MTYLDYLRLRAAQRALDLDRSTARHLAGSKRDPEPCPYCLDPTCEQPDVCGSELDGPPDDAA